MLCQSPAAQLAAIALCAAANERSALAQFFQCAFVQRVGDVLRGNEAGALRLEFLEAAGLGGNAPGQFEQACLFLEKPPVGAYPILQCRCGHMLSPNNSGRQRAATRT